MKFIIRRLVYDSVSRLCSQHTCASAVYNTAEKKLAPGHRTEIVRCKERLEGMTSRPVGELTNRWR